MIGIKTFILAGGLGTRLRSKISDLPKSMAPVAGRPFLEWQLMALKEQGFTDVVLCVGYLAEKIIDYFGDGSKFGMNIDYSIEREPLGTAGAIRNASKFVDSTFLLLNGDTFFDVDYRGLLEFHEAKDVMLSLSLIMAEDVSRYGSVAVDINNRVVGFKEKQASSQGFGYINAGVYAAEPSILNYIAPQKAVSLENNVIPTIMETGRVYGYISDGYFIDIGTPESYEVAQKFFERYHDF
ncbi:MAG: nucleotidyltransferase family protein [Actinomycetota bacterium]|nr:nucleotidyltransferase family protein [Actinomycetota bacterium]